MPWDGEKNLWRIRFHSCSNFRGFSDEPEKKPVPGNEPVFLNMGEQSIKQNSKSCGTMDGEQRKSLKMKRQDRTKTAA